MRRCKAGGKRKQQWVHVIVINTLKYSKLINKTLTNTNDNQSTTCNDKLELQVGN